MTPAPIAPPVRCSWRTSFPALHRRIASAGAPASRQLLQFQRRPYPRTLNCSARASRTRGTPSVTATMESWTVAKNRSLGPRRTPGCQVAVTPHRHRRAMRSIIFLLACRPGSYTQLGYTAVCWPYSRATGLLAFNRFDPEAFGGATVFHGDRCCDVGLIARDLAMRLLEEAA